MITEHDFDDDLALRRRDVGICQGIVFGREGDSRFMVVTVWRIEQRIGDVVAACVTLEAARAVAGLMALHEATRRAWCQEWWGSA